MNENQGKKMKGENIVKRITMVMLSFIIAFSVVPTVDYANGESIIYIDSQEGLENMTGDGNYELTCNIKLDDNFKIPVNFSGVLDGAGYMISNMPDDAAIDSHNLFIEYEDDDSFSLQLNGRGAYIGYPEGYYAQRTDSAYNKRISCKKDNDPRYDRIGYCNFEISELKKNLEAKKLYYYDGENYTNYIEAANLLFYAFENYEPKKGYTNVLTCYESEAKPWDSWSDWNDKPEMGDKLFSISEIGADPVYVNEDVSEYFYDRLNTSDLDSITFGMCTDIRSLLGESVELTYPKLMLNFNSSEHVELSFRKGATDAVNTVFSVEIISDDNTEPVLWSLTTDKDGNAVLPIMPADKNIIRITAVDKEGTEYKGEKLEDGSWILYAPINPIVTYEQYSGKTETKNNDPLLIIGTVKGEEGAVPTGRVYFMFSGDLSDYEPEYTEESILKDGETQNEFVANLRRVMDSGKDNLLDIDTAKGDNAKDTYNGYAQLVEANITFDKDSDENAGKYDEQTGWIQIPDELGQIPVRISVGKDESIYYKTYDESTNTFSYETTKEECENSGTGYSLVVTYEYTTLVDNSGEAITLGELVNTSQMYIKYLEYEIKKYNGSTGDWDSVGDEVKWSPKETTQAFATDFTDLQNQILEWINDDDISNDFWYQSNSSFGMYITYEYIATNICFTKYIPDNETAANPYVLTNSLPKVLTPEAKEHSLSIKIYRQEDGSGDWKEIIKDNMDSYVVDYNDNIKIVIEDSAENATGAVLINALNNEGNKHISFQTEGGKLEYIFRPSAGQNESGWDSTVNISRLYDGSYTQVNASIYLKINQRTDAAIPSISKLESVKIDSGKTYTLEPTITVGDEGVLSYEWYVSDEELDTSTENWKDSLELVGTEPVYTITNNTTKAQTKYYYLVVTNINESVNGDKTGEAVEYAVVTLNAKSSVSYPQKEEINDENVISLIEESNLQARTRYTKNMNTNVYLICEEENILEKIEAAGYKIQYQFYRSTEKRSGYEFRLAKDTGSYINTIGKKNTMYYYRIKLVIYNKEDEYIGETKVLNCWYGNRLWQGKLLEKK